MYCKYNVNTINQNDSYQSIKKGYIKYNFCEYTGGRVKYPWIHGSMIIQTHVIVALDSVDESLISHDLGFSAEERLETLFDCLQLLLADLKETLTDRRQMGYCSLWKPI